MNLKILLPFEIFVEKTDVMRIVAETPDGSFAILPHRLDCVAALVPGILIYETPSDGETFVAIDEGVIINNAASIIHEAELYVFSVISSAVHMCWVKAVAGRLKTDIRYTSSTCYNTFPLPKLTAKNKEDLTRCAEDILLAREAHFPTTIADLYDPEKMPDDLRHAHERNDEVLERIYIGRRFKNDTERLEKLFELYTKMTNKRGGL